MNKLIACCGLNCETCDAFIATLKNDDQLRKETAEKWQKAFSAPGITAESINCTGCREEGPKFTHCSACEVRKCVNAKGYETCAACADMETCDIVGFIHKAVPEAITNLRGLN